MVFSFPLHTTIFVVGLAARSNTTCGGVVVVVGVVGNPGVPVKQSGCSLRSETIKINF